MEFSSHTATLYSNWDGFYDPESGIDKYDIEVRVNGEETKAMRKTGDTTHIADHTMHFQHGDEIDVTVTATDGATR